MTHHSTQTKPTLLCVDDEPAIIASLERVLRNDFCILRADNPNEALKLLNQNPSIAIVLSDYQMPNLNGIEFLEKVKATTPTAARCILSGQIDLSNVTAAISDATIHRFILKPWDNELLRLQMIEIVQIHEMLKERESLTQLAITDPITQLTNHRYFQENIKSLFLTAKQTKVPLSVIMIDVDHFKSYNDHYGHPEGDRLLSLIASRLKEYSTKEYSVSRYGGEEFVLIAPELTGDRALDLAEDIRLAFEKKAFEGPNGRPAYITISIGVASLQESSSSSDELVCKADQALYQAKRQGRNQVVLA